MSERLLFVCIPTRLLLEPPLAHRGSSDPRTVTPFAFALLTGILVAARAKWREAHGYRQHREEPRPRGAPATIKLTLSRYALLRGSLLPDNGRNRRALDGALDRLCNLVGWGDEPHSALLTGWFETRSGKLCLSVCGEWLDPPWNRVPLPLPLRSVNAAALFLFLHAVKVDGNAEENRAIALDKLCNRLGIPFWRPALDKRRVDAALAIINHHLNDLNVDTRRALMSLRPSLVGPARYKIFARRCGTRICFTREEFTFDR
jgi:hypothetical protein